MGRDAEIERLHARIANLEHFVSRLAHELSTPLVTARGFASLLLDTGDFDAGTRESLQRIERAAARAELIVRERVDAVTVGAAERLDIGVVLLEAVARATRDHPGLHVSSQVPVGAGADVFATEPVVVQLLSDALVGLARRGAGGPLVVRCPEGASDVVTVVMVGDGPGLSPEEDRAVHDSTTTDRALARLAAAAKLALGQGGRLWCHGDEAAGSGSAVTIALPGYRGD